MLCLLVLLTLPGCAGAGHLDSSDGAGGTPSLCGDYAWGPLGAVRTYELLEEMTNIAGTYTLIDTYMDEATGLVRRSSISDLVSVLGDPHSRSVQDTEGICNSEGYFRTASYYESTTTTNGIVTSTRSETAVFHSPAFWTPRTMAPGDSWTRELDYTVEFVTARVEDGVTTSTVTYDVDQVFTVGDYETLTVPAGTFETVEVTQATWYGGEKQWYAPGVGLVADETMQLVSGP